MCSSSRRHVPDRGCWCSCPARPRPAPGATGTGTCGRWSIRSARGWRSGNETFCVLPAPDRLGVRRFATWWPNCSAPPTSALTSCQLVRRFTPSAHAFERDRQSPPQRPGVLLGSPGRSAARPAVIPRSSRRSAAWTISIILSWPRGASDWKSHSTSQFSVRPTIPGCASIPSGSVIGPTARSSMLRIRPRNIRISTRSTSRAKDWTSLWLALVEVTKFAFTAVSVSSASTTRIRKRSASGNG